MLVCLRDYPCACLCNAAISAMFMYGQPNAAVISYDVTRTAPAAAVEAGSRRDLSGEALLADVSVVLRQARGGVVVVSRSAPQVVVFESGRVSSQAGRVGMGPAEFQDANGAALFSADSLAVIDRMLRRVSIFDPAGKFVRSFNVKPPFATPPFDITIAALRSGKLLIGFVEAPALQPTPSPVSTTLHLVSYDSNGRAIKVVGRYFHSEHFVQAMPHGGIAFWDRVYGRRGVIIATDSSYFAGDASKGELRHYDHNGAVRELHRFALTPALVPRGEIERYRRKEIADERPQDRPIEEARVRQMPYPKYYPAFRRVVRDHRGRLWLEQYPRNGVKAAPVWAVLDPAAHTVANVSFPAGFVPYDFYGSRVIGIGTDSDGVQVIVDYGLSR